MYLGDAEKAAKQYMEQWGLHEWTFGFDNSRVRFGVCMHSRKRIQLSRYLTMLNQPVDVVDTILHEIAHALAGPRHGHDKVWRRYCNLVGAKPERCYQAHVERPERKYVGTCPGCSRTTKRHRRDRVACRTCCTTHNHGKFSEQYLFTWKEVTETTS